MWTTAIPSGLQFTPNAESAIALFLALDDMVKNGRTYPEKLRGVASGLHAHVLSRLADAVHPVNDQERVSATPEDWQERNDSVRELVEQVVGALRQLEAPRRERRGKE